MIIGVYFWDKLMQYGNESNIKRLKQGLILCLLSWGAAAHADAVKSYVPEMVVVPAGSFLMSSPPDDASRRMSEDPRHLVTIAQPFAVGTYEVTFAEWDYCVADGGCNGYRPDDMGWGRDKRPVINVNWNDAHAYIDWLNKKSGKQYRLLSESEWEYVARAGTSTTYYWGNDIGNNNANCKSCGSQWDGKQTAPVGSFKPNAFGLYDMLGNVREWTEDAYHTTYNGAPADGSVWHGDKAARYVLRGGSWNFNAVSLRTAERDWFETWFRGQFVGFRVARTLP